MTTPPGFEMEWVVPLIFALVGGLFVALGIHALRVRRSFQRRAEPALGQVTDLRWYSTRSGTAGTGTSGGFVAHPVLRFQTPDGRTVEVDSFTGRNPAPARVGQQVTVLYNPQDPTQAVLEGDSVTSVLWIVFIAFGGLFLLGGLGDLLITVLLGLLFSGSL